jgi:F420-non-reducing hydrogenase small subunit
MTVRLVEEWFNICGGCEVTILDMGEALLDLLQQIQIVHMPMIMDHKHLSPSGDNPDHTIDIPEAEIGLISGGIRTEEQKKLALEMRRKCKTLIVLGTCATCGGVPALANQFTRDDMLGKIYLDSASTDVNGIPNEDLPSLTSRVFAISEVVTVDLQLPGCPPTPEMVAGALNALLTKQPFRLSHKSVCDECPTRREKKIPLTLKRRFEDAQFTPGAPLHEMLCHMEQGFLCLGPATRAGCGGSEGIPRCIKAYQPCEGCFGPLSEKANPMVDMMGALSSVGIDPKQIPDRAATLNRFSGAGRLHPLPKR